MQALRFAKDAAMGYAELIEQLQALPQDKQAEVFDFVEFLSRRTHPAEAAPGIHTDWADADFAALAGQAFHDDDPIEYTAADLRERWR